MPTQRTVALVRCSTAHQEVDSQRTAIERWARAQGADVATWYEEAAVSGAARERAVLERLLVDARRGEFDTLVVFKLDRLGRSAVRVIQHLHELDLAKVRVVSLTEALDFATPAGRLVASVLAHVAEIERASNRERTRAGLDAARERGVPLGRPATVWRTEEVEALRALRAVGHSLAEIRTLGLLRVFDAKQRPVTPSVRAMRRALAATS